jgi:hypothetical protein
MRNYVFIVKCVIALGVISIGSANAGPPFVTDDPEPVEYQHWEINYGLSKTWSEDAFAAAFPSVDINYGYTENVQLHIQPKYSFIDDTNTRFNSIDNTEVGVKYRMFNRDDTDSVLMVGVYPMIQLPTGDNKLSSGSGKTQIFLPVWAQYEKNDWTFYGGAGYRFNNWVDSKNSVFVGALASYQITNKFSLGGELFNESAVSIADKSTSGFNIGGAYKCTDDYHLLFSVGKGINDLTSSNRLSMYIALQAIY